MIKEYIEQARLNITPLQKVNVYLSEKYEQKLTKDVKSITFENMYPIIFKQMFDNRYLPKSEEPYIKRIERWLTRKETGLYKEMSTQTYQELRTFKNAYYGHLYRRNPEYCQLLTEYINVFYTNLKKVVKDDNLIYYDTDTIFVKEINDDIINELNKLDIVYYIDDIRYIYVEGLKRLIWTNPYGGIEVKGMRSSKRASRYKYASKNADLLEEIIRREMRNDTLEKILQ